MNRVVNEEIISFLEKYYSRSDKPLHIIYEAPTGYGKTFLAPYIASIVQKQGISTSYIHVLPMRSIVRKVYDEMIKRRIENTCYQAGGLFLFGKNPFLSCNANIVTFDSYMLNLVRIGVGEASKHYESARLMIFTSTITYDEAHLYGGDPGNPEENLYTSFLASLETVSLANSPVIVTTATLPEQLAEKIYNTFSRILGITKASILWIRYGRFVRSKINTDIGQVKIEHHDKEYDKLVNNVKWYTEVIIENKLEKICRDIVDKGSSNEKILVVMNKPSRALKIYECLIEKGLKPVLIHGRMKYGEREEIEKKLDNTQVLIATQVVEAGINMDFDILYTDIAPISNLIQRAGRINRWFKREDGKIVVIVDEESYKEIYPENIIINTLNTIKKKIESNKHSINWRNPYTCYELLEETYRNTTIKLDHSIDIELRYLMRSLYVDTREIEKIFLQKCIKSKGFIRGSILVPLIHLEDNIDRYGLHEIYMNTVPASFSWVLSKSKELFGKEIKVLFLEKEENKDSIELVEENIDKSGFKQHLCRYLVGIVKSKNRVFLGLLVKPDAYIKGRGLLV